MLGELSAFVVLGWNKANFRRNKWQTVPS